MAYVSERPEAKAKRIVDAALRLYFRDVLFLPIAETTEHPKMGRPPAPERNMPPDEFLGVPTRYAYSPPEETPLPQRRVLRWIVMDIADSQGYRLPIYKLADEPEDRQWQDNDGLLLRPSFVADIEREIKAGRFRLLEYEVEEEVIGEQDAAG